MAGDSYETIIAPCVDRKSARSHIVNFLELPFYCHLFRRYGLSENFSAIVFAKRVFETGDAITSLFCPVHLFYLFGIINGHSLGTTVVEMEGKKTVVALHLDAITPSGQDYSDASKMRSHVKTGV